VEIQPGHGAGNICHVPGGLGTAEQGQHCEKEGRDTHGRVFITLGWERTGA
jgi:hypothetical protein